MPAIACSHLCVSGDAAARPWPYLEPDVLVEDAAELLGADCDQHQKLDADVGVVKVLQASLLLSETARATRAKSHKHLTSLASHNGSAARTAAHSKSKFLPSASTCLYAARSPEPGSQALSR